MATIEIPDVPPAVQYVSFIGSVIATCLSWKVNASVGWCIFHFFCGWIYVIYYAICK
jgi:hypothetical protein